MSWIQFAPRWPPKKRANSTLGLLAGSRIPRSDVAPPAGFEPALPPPESGTQVNSCDVLTSRNQLSAPPHLYAWTRIGHSTGTRRRNRWERYAGGDLQATADGAGRQERRMPPGSGSRADS